ncbi:hypothetical protein [Thermomonas carbonis]|uniref:Uncharacterized protein n=1 Tax=Thermomonas carbonis TaxID=1463158 RepID=A0A7G9SU09_9GAMM|nr:hypothetical protein [Thermomonas carbonis]QNN71334.1 hypothetical protein H9L16_07225 [Thermomonas carbonis]GHC10286.1 hypothetical protein GCM10010080_27260 [Thermomonas carbonis]
MFRRLLLALALTSTVACSMPVAARDLVLLDVVDRDSRQILPEYRHRGQDWIAGVPGHRYSVRLTNNTGERVLVVLSVDGVNAVTGQTASPSQGGYVLEPWESAEIAGWRKSLDDIAQFVFTDLPDSYAARTGRPANVGVVGVAVFRERQVRPVYAPPPAPPIAGGMARNEARKAAASAASADRAMASEAEAMPQRLGTGHGQREWAPVGQTEFVRASRTPQQVSQLRYDDADALIALGILPRYRAPYAGTTPRAFPNGFVQDPPYRH